MNHLGEYDHDELGHAFEAMVGAQLVRTGEALYYWREGHLEVDFVVKRGPNLWAIEVKSGRSKRVEGVTAFKKRRPTAKSVIITPDTYKEFETDPIEFLTDHAC